jgi:hypothetical protein
VDHRSDVSKQLSSFEIALIALHPDRVLLDLMQRNVDLNFPQHVGADETMATCPVKVAELDWGGELPDGMPHEPEIILAADCVYFEVRF